MQPEWMMTGKYFVQMSEKIPLILSLCSMLNFPYPPHPQLFINRITELSVYQITTSLNHLTGKLIRQFNQDFLWILVSKTYSIGYYFISKATTYFILHSKNKVNSPADVARLFTQSSDRQTH